MPCRRKCRAGRCGDRSRADDRAPAEPRAPPAGIALRGSRRRNRVLLAEAVAALGASNIRFKGGVPTLSDWRVPRRARCDRGRGRSNSRRGRRGACLATTAPGNRGYRCLDPLRTVFLTGRIVERPTPLHLIPLTGDGHRNVFLARVSETVLEHCPCCSSLAQRLLWARHNQCLVCPNRGRKRASTPAAFGAFATGSRGLD